MRGRRRSGEEEEEEEEAGGTKVEIEALQSN